MLSHPIPASVTSMRSFCQLLLSKGRPFSLMITVPRLRKANTKDVAVQVNPKRDASVQCSIGPRTLLSMKRDFRRKSQQQEEEEAMSPGGRSGSGSPKPASGVRYPRTLAVYSPIAYRSVTSFLVDDNNNNNNDDVKETSCADANTVTPGEPPDTQATESGEKTQVHILNENNKIKQTTKSEDTLPAAEGSKVKARVRFQFLEQKYGYYHCRECNLRWESAYVWCVQGTNKVYFKQYCRKCQKEFNPYRVEDITCHTCNKARCSCALTQRHVDPKRPHRQDLCGRCKGKRLSCDSTFSFKYII